MHINKSSNHFICSSSKNLNGEVLLEENDYVFEEETERFSLETTYPDLVMLILFTAIGFPVNIKFLNILEKEGNRKGGCLTKQVMTMYTKVQMVGWPLLGLIVWLLGQDFHFSLMFGYWFCFALKFAIHLFRLYIGFNSLIVSAMRYTFIAKQEKITMFGKEKAMKLFYYGSLLIPLSITIFSDFTMGTPTKNLSYIHKCLEPYREIYIGGDGGNTSTDVTMFLCKTPGYIFFNQFVSPKVTIVLGYILKVLTVVMISNVPEGILYMMAFRYIRRSSTSDFLNVALSDEAKIKRQRINTVNIKMAAISWMLEFVAGCLVIVCLIFNRHTNLLRILTASDFCLNFILLPCTYLINNETTKRIIALESIWLGIKNIFNLYQEPETRPAVAPQPVPVPIPNPIPTISGNIEALANMKLPEMRLDPVNNLPSSVCVSDTNGRTSFEDILPVILRNNWVFGSDRTVETGRPSPN